MFLCRKCLKKVAMPPKHPMKKASGSITTEPSVKSAAKAKQFQQFLSAYSASNHVGQSATHPTLRPETYQMTDGSPNPAFRMKEDDTVDPVMQYLQTPVSQLSLETESGATNISKRNGNSSALSNHHHEQTTKIPYIRDLHRMKQLIRAKQSEEERKQTRREFVQYLERIQQLFKEKEEIEMNQKILSNYELNTFELMKKYERVVMMIRPKHFVDATTPEICKLLRIATFMRTNCSHLVQCGTQTLLYRLESLTGSQLANVVLSVSLAKDGGLTPEQQVKLQVAFFAQILRHPSEHIREMSVGQASFIMRLGLDQGGAAVIPEGMSKQFLKEILVIYTQDFDEKRVQRQRGKTAAGGVQKEEKSQQKKHKKKKGKQAGGDDDTSRALAMDVQHVATICNAVVFHKMATEEAVKFFVAARDMCIDEVNELTGKQLSKILHAYATVQVHDVKLFLALGHRVGELGENLSVGDVGRVLNAFDMTSIGYDQLRRSLESSMRMRSITKKAHTFKE